MNLGEFLSPFPARSTRTAAPVGDGAGLVMLSRWDDGAFEQAVTAMRIVINIAHFIPSAVELMTVGRAARRSIVGHCMTTEQSESI